MIRLIVMLIFSFFAAKSVKKNTGDLKKLGIRNLNIWLFIAALLMIGLIGLRTDYNDTNAYIKGFLNAETLSTFLSDLSLSTWDKYPLFNLYTVSLRSLTDNYHIYFMIPAVFIVFSYLNFFLKECEPDVLPYTIFLYFTFGTYFFSLAAMKQSIAMAILTYAIIAIQQDKNVKFIIIVLIATLFHTYALMFIILLFFKTKPYDWKTLLLLVSTIFIMQTFENTFTTLFQYADDIGVGIVEEGLFNSQGLNYLRIAVYSITPLITLFGNRILKSSMKKEYYVLINMSILSFMFMLIGSINGANLFGRMARYYELGTLIVLPWAIKNMFEVQSSKLIYSTMIVLFFCFWLYDYKDFNSVYSGITFIEFIKSLL